MVIFYPKKVKKTHFEICSFFYLYVQYDAEILHSGSWGSLLKIEYNKIFLLKKAFDEISVSRQRKEELY